MDSKASVAVLQAQFDRGHETGAVEHAGQHVALRQLLQAQMFVAQLRDVLRDVDEAVDTAVVQAQRDAALRQVRPAFARRMVALELHRLAGQRSRAPLTKR